MPYTSLRGSRTVGLALAAWLVAAPPFVDGDHALARSTQAAAAVYACPMHPDVTSATPGKCSRCGMTLVVMDAYDAREYLVDLATEPRTIHAGEPFTLHLTVREPLSRAVVREFATVHEKRFHLFVISQDLEQYQHVHPEQQQDGSWSLQVTLPKPGYYRVYSDFLPAGGTPQVIAAPLVTSGFRGDIVSASANLVPDRGLVTNVGSMRVSLALPDSPLVAGREEIFAFELSDRQTDAPVTDLEPYLAAWGHTLLLSEDTLSVVHAHPVELVPPDQPNPHGGPVITFKALFPKPGNYRLWTQMKRGGQLMTAVYTLGVKSSADQ